MNKFFFEKFMFFSLTTKRGGFLPPALSLGAKSDRTKTKCAAFHGYAILPPALSLGAKSDSTKRNGKAIRVLYSKIKK
jgi:hypothetical protein